MPSIVDLPSELLSHIFGEYIAPPSAGLPSELRAICKRWREVAEATPDIWDSMVLGYGPKWTRRALDWSASCPIVVSATMMGISHADWHDCVVWALHHLHRTRVLELQFPPHHFPGRIAEIMDMLKDRPAPLLEVFHLDGPRSSSRPTLDDTFGSAPPPGLKDLRLSACTVILHSPILRAPQLANLAIEDCALWETMDEVLETLTALPQLETFRWHGKLLDSPHFTVPALSSSSKLEAGSIRMSNLHSLDICHNVEVIVHLLAQVEIPPSCNIILKGDLLNNPAPATLIDAMDRVLSPYLSARFPLESGTGFEGFTIIDFWYRMGRGLTAQWSMDAAVDAFGTRNDDFCLSLHGGHFDDDAKLNMIWRLIDRWPATRVAVRKFAARHYMIFGNRPSDLSRFIPSWVTVLATFESVEEISVGEAIAHLPALLSSPHFRLFPRLQLVVVHFADIASSEVGLLVTGLLQRHDVASTSAPYRIILEHCRVDNIPRPRREIIVTEGGIKQ